MRRARLFAFGMCVLAVLFGATRNGPSLRAQNAGPALAPIVGRAVQFAVTPPLRDLPPDETVKPEDVDDSTAKTVPIRTFRTEVDTGGTTVDPVAQRSAPVVLAVPAPSLTFPGLTNDDNFALFGFRVSPPDTVGDVGPNHYVQMVNLVWQVYDKSGTPLLVAARKLSSIWAALGAGNPCSTADDGDPIVLYDPLADRWLLSQFCVVANPNTHQLIAISQTPDPTGAYFLYDFMMPNDKFNDYPKFGVWPDAYYMTDNQFNQAGFVGAGVFAFDRAMMLAGNPSATYIYFDLATDAATATAGGMLPADLDGFNPPPPGTPGYFAYFTADEFSDPADALRIFEFHADFANAAASTFTERAESPLPVAAFDPHSPVGRDDIEQPPPAVTATASLDSISDRLMHRLAYRNFGAHESLVTNHTVNVGTGTDIATHQAGVRYYELQRALPGGAFAVQEQATFAPDADNRWMGSAAQDKDGNLAVGYSVSSDTTFPSIRYAARLATDPPGGLFQGETTLIAGTGVQRTTSSRWGDYSAMSVDPLDDCTFWYTNEYYTAASQAASTAGWVTHIGSFTIPTCTPVAKGTVQGIVTNVTGLPIGGAIVQSSAGHLTVTDALGAYAFMAVPGTYDLMASAPSHLSATASIVVSDGETTIQDFALTPIPVLMAAGASALSSESCGPPTGAIDPGETVEVSLSIQNTGAADTVNLVATLLPTGGVTNPGSPQTYGVVQAGGPAVSRTFQFTADPALTCGGALTATLSLQDGASSLGTLSYSLTVGTLSNATFTDTYTGGGLPAPISDLSTIEIPIDVPVGAAGAIADINVRLRLNHTFDADLVISLVHPDGTVVTLSNGRGGAGDNFGTGTNDCGGTPTVFDDEAGVAIASGVAPFAGSFRPDSPLSALDGKPTAGTWKLRISDVAPADVGTVGCVQIEVNRRVFLCCPFSGGAPVVGGVPPVTVVGESCSPGNGAVDPDETVMVSFPLQNVGTSPTVDLVAMLLPGGGVNTPSGPQHYGALSPVGPPEARTFSFVPSGACGGTVTATLQLEDVGGGGPLGDVTFNMTIGGTTTSSTSFSNSAAITIPASGTSGPATPYPSTINVSGVTGTVSKVTATLADMSHTFPDDVDVLLVGPGGQSVLLMSDAGGSTNIVNVTLTFDDAAAALPNTAPIASGTYQPSNYGTGDTFPAPAPAGPYPDPQLLSVFNGVDPNGTWSLFINDDAAADIGAVAGGWTLTITTEDPLCCSQACALTCPAPITQGTDPNMCTAVVGFPDVGVVGSCGTIACVPPSGSVFPVGTTTDNCASTSTIDGSTTDTCNFPVTVVDVEAPAILDTLASPATLWPPNHRMVDVLVDYAVAENCAGACSLSVISNEPVNGLGDGDRQPDWAIVDAHRVRLRAERSGTGTGRIYTITIACTDTAGNRSTRDVIVRVPHDQR